MNKEILLIFFSRSSELLVRQLEEIKFPINDRELSLYIHNNYQEYLANQNMPYRCTILVKSPLDLKKEIHHMIKGIHQSVLTGHMWKTPNGSIFFPNAFEARLKVAFIYPGNGSAYPGLGYHMLRKFPAVKKAFNYMAGEYAQNAMQEALIFPNGQFPTSENYLLAEKQLNDDFYKVSSASLSFSWMYTYLLTQVFGIQSQFAFGYSIGEIAMLLALGVWQDPMQIYTNIMNSPTFFEGITGEMHSVKHYWSTQGKFHLKHTGPIWKNIILRGSQDQLDKILRNSKYIYLMARNTKNEFMLGGDVDEVSTVAQNFSSQVTELPYRAAVHVPIIRLEREALKTIYSAPAQSISMQLFSAVSQTPTYNHPNSIAETVTATIEQVIDFPALVRRVYHAGARIFIEVGGRNICSNWINQILKDQPHITIPLNIKGINDYFCILKALSVLIGCAFQIKPSALNEIL